jgi:hypothetical protein
LTQAVISFEQIKLQTMKKILLPCLMTAALFMILLIPVKAQDNEHKKIHVVIEENGSVTTDTTVLFNKDVSEQEIEAAILGITGEKNPPCHAGNETARHCDTVAYKCCHMQKSELDSLLEVSGKTFSCTHSDTCRHAEGSHGSCMNHTEKGSPGQEPCRHAEKKVIEKKITVTVEGDKAEKTIILESPAETEKKSKKDH